MWCWLIFVKNVHVAVVFIWRESLWKEKQFFYPEFLLFSVYPLNGYGLLHATPYSSVCIGVMLENLRFTTSSRLGLRHNPVSTTFAGNNFRPNKYSNRMQWCLYFCVILTRLYIRTCVLVKRKSRKQNFTEKVLKGSCAVTCGQTEGRTDGRADEQCDADMRRAQPASEKPTQHRLLPEYGWRSICMVLPRHKN